MTSKLKVNILADGGDNAIMTSDGSGSLTLNNAALKNTPAFNVRMNTLQSISHETDTLVAFDTEIYDTDSAFDNTASNYKFTVPSGKAGKYYFFASTNLDAVSAANLQNCQMYFYKNGSVQHKISTNFNSNDIKAYQATLSTTFDLSAGDYVQVYARISDSSGSPRIDGSDTAMSQFFGFRMVE
jgi:hypothetical protein